VIGIDPSKPNSRAVLTSCLGGRLVLQTFDTHEYSREDMLKLWQNYVYYTLTNHFVYTQNNLFTTSKVFKTFEVVSYNEDNPHRKRYSFLTNRIFPNIQA